MADSGLGRHVADSGLDQHKPLSAAFCPDRCLLSIQNRFPMMGQVVDTVLELLRKADSRKPDTSGHRIDKQIM